MQYRKLIITNHQIIKLQTRFQLDLYLNDQLFPSINIYFDIKTYELLSPSSFLSGTPFPLFDYLKNTNLIEHCSTNNFKLTKQALLEVT